ncbi:TPA: hypothetical protein ACTXF0_003736 [Klebsiella pneumoniae]
MHYREVFKNPTLIDTLLREGGEEFAQEMADLVVANVKSMNLN